MWKPTSTIENVVYLTDFLFLCFTDVKNNKNVRAAAQLDTSSDEPLCVKTILKDPLFFNKKEALHRTHFKPFKYTVLYLYAVHAETPSNNHTHTQTETCTHTHTHTHTPQYSSWFPVNASGNSWNISADIKPRLWSYFKDRKSIRGNEPKSIPLSVISQILWSYLTGPQGIPSDGPETHYIIYHVRTYKFCQ